MPIEKPVALPAPPQPTQEDLIEILIGQCIVIRDGLQREADAHRDSQSPVSQEK